LGNPSRVLVGKISELWRYPVKTMQGELLETASITHKGLSGDRSFALVDKNSGRIISAKNPNKWKHVFNFSSSTFVSEEGSNSPPRISISFSDGDTVFTDDENVNEILSKKIGTPVILTSQVPENATMEKVTLEDDEREKTQAPSHLEKLSPFDFFDGGPLHILTTRSLNRLQDIYKEGNFEARRFRPNIVIDSDDTDYGSDTGLSMEQSYEDLMLEIGDTVKVKITKPTVRCIITTLAQPDLPKDNKVLKTIDMENGGYLGVYTQTLEPGSVKMGDLVWMVGSKLTSGRSSSTTFQDSLPLA
jgi:uncharacterized protein